MLFMVYCLEGAYSWDPHHLFAQPRYLWHFDSDGGKYLNSRVEELILLRWRDHISMESHLISSCGPKNSFSLVVLYFSIKQIHKLKNMRGGIKLRAAVWEASCDASFLLSWVLGTSCLVIFSQSRSVFTDANCSWMSLELAWNSYPSQGV